MDESSRNSLPLGTVLNSRYEIGTVLGEGGFSIIYLARNGDSLVAVKEYFPKDCAHRVLGSSQIVALDQPRFNTGLIAFVLEAEITQRFSGHPYLVSGIEAFEANGTCYQIMEYVEGHSLKQVLVGQKVMAPHQAVYTLLPILKALSLLHEHGIVHRDVSPDNVTIARDGHAVLMDLGSAIHGDTAHEVVLKPGYSPVEQYRVDGRLGGYTDVYAAGALLYRMITGKVPPESVTRLTEDTLTRPSELVECPMGVEKAVMRALAVRPDERFATSNGFYQALLEV